MCTSTRFLVCAVALAWVFAVNVRSDTLAALALTRGTVVSVDKDKGTFTIKSRKNAVNANQTIKLTPMTHGRDLIVPGKQISVVFDRESNVAVRIRLVTGSTSSSAKAGARGDKVAALERKAQQCVTAKDALLLYKLFIDDPKTTDAERQRAQQGLKHWREAAAKGLERVGKEWMSAEDAKARREQAHTLIREAIDLLAVDNDKLCKRKLQEASRVDPDSFEADFFLGVLYALVGRDSKNAERHFSICVKRTPKNVAALNNLALCEVKQEKYAQAVAHWTAAVELATDSQEVAQNLGRFISFGSNGVFGRLPSKVMSDASSSYTSCLASGEVKASKVGNGWYYMLPFGRAKQDPKAQSSTIVSGAGTGFVVGNGYVLTNRHVVAGSQSVLIKPFHATETDDKGEEDSLVAEVIEVSSDFDIALLHCDKLDAPAVKLAADLADRSSDVMALGFPLTFSLGASIKSTRGTIAALPDRDTNDMYLVDVKLNPGNSGGPLCDQSGKVIGINTMVTHNERFVQGYGLAIPIQEAFDLIEKHLPDIQPAKDSGELLDWTEVDKLVSKSTVLVIITKQETPLVKLTSTFWTDSACVQCDGGGKEACNARGCIKGSIRTPTARKVGVNRITGKAILQKVFVPKSCKRCGGDGVVSCRLCRGSGTN